jgi:transcriptional regulator with XRE-family HTH domain
LLVADYPQMNFTQMHERLRLELLRRIQRGTVSVSLLARQTGFGQSHLSNFLHNRRQLSLEAMDRILAAQHMTAGDLLPATYQQDALPADGESSSVPVVSHAVALFEPYIRPSATQAMLHLPAGLLQSIRTRASNPRRAWQRFVAVRIPAADALPMEPLVLPEALTLIDRHYTSLMPYRPNRPNLYAVRSRLPSDTALCGLCGKPAGAQAAQHCVSGGSAGGGPGETPSELIAGRIALILNEP